MPFMADRVKLAVQLAQGDGLGVQAAHLRSKVRRAIFGGGQELWVYLSGLVLLLTILCCCECVSNHASAMRF